MISIERHDVHGVRHEQFALLPPSLLANMLDQVALHVHTLTQQEHGWTRRQHTTAHG